MPPAYLQAVSHDDHTGIGQGTEELLCGPLLLLSVVLLLCLQPEQKWVTESMECPSSSHCQQGTGKGGFRAVALSLCTVTPSRRVAYQIVILRSITVAKL